MCQLEINGIQESFKPDFVTWQDLLTDLESARLEPEEVIASVKFDGEEVLQFREESVLAKGLQSMRQIRIEVIPIHQMALNATSDATRYLQTLELALADVAEALRNELIAQANVKLQEVFDGVKLFVTLVRGIELSIEGMPAGENSEVETAFQAMKPTLENMIEAQTQQDWVLLADLLEYELLANLSSFEQIMAGFQEKLAVGSNY